MSDSKQRIRHHITNASTTVSAVLREHFGLDPLAVQLLLDLGAVYSDKKRVFEDRKTPKGTYLRIHLEPKRYPSESIDWASCVLAEDSHYLVVRKPAGIPVHASLDNALENVLHQMRLHLKMDLLVTQRLDVPVEGLLVLAKTPQFQRHFNRLLSERKVHKVYKALVQGCPPLGTSVHYMRPDKFGKRHVETTAHPGWLECSLSITKAEPWPGEVPRGHQVELQLHTGRTHQIRAQLSALGCPVFGDRAYGSKQRWRPEPLEPRRERIALFCAELGWQEADRRVNFALTPPWLC